MTGCPVNVQLTGADTNRIVVAGLTPNSPPCERVVYRRLACGLTSWAARVVIRHSMGDDASL